jgi:hypothetical protein
LSIFKEEKKMFLSMTQLKKTFVIAPVLSASLLFSACFGLPVAVPRSAPDAPPAAVATAEAPAESSAKTAIPTIPVVVTADWIDMPKEVPSGVVRFAVENQPGEESPEIVRLNDGVTVEQLMAAMQEDMMAALALVEMIGSTRPDVEVVYDLDPGTYLTLLFQPEAAPLMALFTAGEASGAEAPTADFTAQLADFAFIMPDTIPAGSHVWHIENVGAQWHELLVVKLEDGMTLQGLMDIIHESDQQGPPPLDMETWWAPMGAGKQAWVTWDLPAGQYAVICSLPDVAGEMAPHTALGMVRVLIVTE